MLFLIWKELALLMLLLISAGYVVFKTVNYVIKISVGIWKILLSLMAIIFALGLIVSFINLIS